MKEAVPAVAEKERAPPDGAEHVSNNVLLASVPETVNVCAELASVPEMADPAPVERETLMTVERVRVREPPATSIKEVLRESKPASWTGSGWNRKLRGRCLWTAE